MRSVQDLQKQVQTAAKNVLAIQMENSCVELFFPTPQMSVWPQFQDLIWKLMLQLLKQFWPQIMKNKEVKLTEKKILF